MEPPHRATIISLDFLSSEYGRPIQATLQDREAGGDIQAALAALLAAKDNNDVMAFMFHSETLGLQHQQSDPDKAETYYMAALFMSDSNKDALHLLGRLAVLYMEKGRMKRYTEHAERALQIVLDMPDLGPLLPAVFAWSVAAMQLLELDRAATFCVAAIKYAQRFRQPSFLRDCYHLQGDICRLLERNKEAIQAYEASAEVAEQSAHSPMHAIRSHNLIGQLHLQSRNFPDAANAHLKALSLASRAANTSGGGGCPGG